MLEKSGTLWMVLVVGALAVGGAAAGLNRVPPVDTEDLYYKGPVQFTGDGNFHWNRDNMGAIIEGYAGKPLVDRRTSMHLNLSGFAGQDVLGDGTLHLFVHDAELLFAVADRDIIASKFNTPLVWWIDVPDGDRDIGGHPYVPAYADADETHQGDFIGSYTMDGAEVHGQEITIPVPENIIQDWIDNDADNYGLLLYADRVSPPRGASGLWLATSNHLNSDLHPYLEFETEGGACNPGDANGDGVVNLLDLDILGQNYGKTDAVWEDGDFNGDKAVNLLDLDILGRHYGQCQDGGAVPEPATLSLLALGASLPLFRRKRFTSHR